jgi:hypothetical protein
MSLKNLVQIQEYGCRGRHVQKEKGLHSLTAKGLEGGSELHLLLL